MELALERLGSALGQVTARHTQSCKNRLTLSESQVAVGMLSFAVGTLFNQIGPEDTQGIVKELFSALVQAELELTGAPDAQEVTADAMSTVLTLSATG